MSTLPLTHLPNYPLARARCGRYYNDLWVLDCEAMQWEAVGRAHTGPSPRSGCQMVVHGDVLYLHGGYSKVPYARLLAVLHLMCCGLHLQRAPVVGLMGSVRGVGGGFGISGYPEVPAALLRAALPS